MKRKLTVSGIEVQLTSKPIKNIYLRITTEGKVQVSAPIHLSEQQVAAFVDSKLPWIQAKRAQQQDNKVFMPQYVSGETHYLWGTPYLLEVRLTRGAGQVHVSDNRIVLFTKDNSTKEQRERLLLEWYRSLMKNKLPGLVGKWEKNIGVQVNFIGVKNMRTRWGSCNIGRKRVWFNLQLAKRPIRLLEYVVVHELVHLLERNHNQRFANYMDHFLPGWQQLKEELNTRL